jgi:hypothetical protein
VLFLEFDFKGKILVIQSFIVCVVNLCLFINRTANHILHEHYVENEEIHIGVHNQQGDLEHKTVYAIHTHIEWDLSVLFFAEDHHAWLQLPALDSMPIAHRIAVISFSSTLFEVLGGTIDASFCVIPGIIAS